MTGRVLDVGSLLQGFQPDLQGHLPAVTGPAPSIVQGCAALWGDWAPSQTLDQLGLPAQMLGLHDTLDN